MHVNWRSGLLLTTLLACGGCALLPSQPPVSLYTLPDGAVPGVSAAVAWQLWVEKPWAAPPLASDRITLRPDAHTYGTFKGARWSMAAPELVQERIVRALSGGGVPGAVRAGVGAAGDYALLSELDSFHADYRRADAPEDAVLVALTVQLVHLPDRRIVASQRFAARQAITGRGMPATIEAFGQALDSVLAQLVPWVVAQGQRHWEHRLERSEAAPQDATPAH